MLIINVFVLHSSDFPRKHQPYRCSESHVPQTHVDAIPPDPTLHLGDWHCPSLRSVWMQNLRLVSRIWLRTNCQQHNWHTSKMFRSRVLIQIQKQCFVNTPLHHDLSIKWFTFCLLWRQAYGEVFIHASESHVQTVHVQYWRSYCDIDKCSRQRKGPCIHVSPRLDVLHSKWMACTACSAAAATSPLLPQFCLYPPPSSSNLSASHSHTQMYILHMLLHTARSTPTSRSQAQLALSSFAYSSACFGIAPPNRALIAKAFISSAPPRWEHFLICVGGGRACLPSCAVYQLYVQHA